MKCVVYFLFLTALLTGCDAYRRINMKNYSGDKASITWAIKMDSINSSPFFISSDREVTFNLSPVPPGNVIKMSFGHGTWRPRQLNNLIDDLDSLVIQSKHGTQSFRTEEDIRKFLMPRRKKIDKSRIDILIDQ
jgi:hypothetical protein